jgi:hypothetical protein
MSLVASKGKWAQGIRPRNFHWVIADRLAVCERPGGYGANHRKVRRQEEIIWVREQGFTCVVSVISAPHNLHNYDELGVVWRHRPVPDDELSTYELGFFSELRDMLQRGERVLIHGEELGDRLAHAGGRAGDDDPAALEPRPAGEHAVASLGHYAISSISRAGVKTKPR